MAIQPRNMSARSWSMRSPRICLAELLRDLVVREVLAIEKRMISAVENQPSMLHSGGENHVAAEVPAVLKKGDYEIARRNSAFEKGNVFCNGIILAIPAQSSECFQRRTP